MDIYEEIKKRAEEAIESGQLRKGLEDILWFIAREEENFRIRKQYYKLIKR